MRLGVSHAYLLTSLLVIAGCQPKPENLPTDPLHAEVALSTNELHVGTQATLTLEVVHPTQGKLLVPDLDQEKRFIVRNLATETEPLPDDRIRTTTIVDFTSFTTGQHVVATNSIVFQGTRDSELSIPFPFASFDVVSLLATNMEARGSKGYLNWRRTLPRWLVALLAVLVLAIGLSLLLVYLTARSNQPDEPVEPSLPPDVLALARLEALQEKGFVDAMDHEPFYVELSDIVREYLERRFALHAPDRTTEEFFREAADTQALSYEHQQLTRSFLEQCDLVKFAKHLPDRSSMTDGFDAAKTLIVETREPTPQEEAAA